MFQKMSTISNASKNVNDFKSFVNFKRVFLFLLFFWQPWIESKTKLIFLKTRFKIDIRGNNDENSLKNTVEERYKGDRTTKVDSRKRKKYIIIYQLTIYNYHCFFSLTLYIE